MGEAGERIPALPNGEDGPSTEWHREPIADPSTAELPVAEACFEVVSHCDSTHELSLTDIRLLDSSGHTIPNALLQRQALPSGTVYAWFHGPAPDDPIWRFYAAVQCVDPASGRAHVTGGMLFIVEAPPTASEAPAPASALRAEGPAAAPRGEMEGGDDG